MKPEEIREMILKEFPEATVELNNIHAGLLAIPNFRGEPSADPFQMIVEFPNHYGASIIRHNGSYGSGLQVEIGILDCHDGKGGLTYDTPITDDVVGYLDEDEIITILKDVEKLGEE